MVFDDKNQYPSEINPNNGRFSVDVFIDIPCLDEHTIGWFDYLEMKWLFLSNQDYSNTEFYWRYFNEKTDYAKPRIKE